MNDLDVAIGLLKIAKCPNCDGSGSIPRQVSSKKYVSSEMASAAGDSSLEGQPYSSEEWEAEQCQWCYERNSLLERTSLVWTFKKQDLESESDDSWLDECEQCGEKAFDHHICHACGMKIR